MIRIGIVGYGNLGKSCEKLLEKTQDMKLVGIFSRRKIKKDGFYKIENLEKFEEEIDVLILCGSSDKDIQSQGPQLIKKFNTVDSFDIHKNIPEYEKQMDELAKENEKIAIISTGWDPGLFSIIRTYSEAILEEGSTYTLWGKGISQGHSAAVRNIEGIKDASQYTIPKKEFIEKVKNGKNLEFSPETAHIREVFAVAKEGYDKKELEEKIKSIPNYFDKYQTVVHFISQEELNKNHKGMPHGGKVLRVGQSPNQNQATIELSLALENNPDFTAAVNIAYARAAYNLKKEKKKGAYTVIDIAPKYLLKEKRQELIKKFI